MLCECVHMCVHVHVCVPVHMCAHMCMCVCVYVWQSMCASLWRPEDNHKCSSLLLYKTSLQDVLLTWSLPRILGWLARKLQGSSSRDPDLHLPSPGFTSTCRHSWHFYVGFWELKSHRHSCMASNLPTNHLPRQCCVLIFYYLSLWVRKPRFTKNK